MEDTSKSRVQNLVERERAYRAEQDTVNRKVLVNLAGMLVLLIASDIYRNSARIELSIVRAGIWNVLGPRSAYG